MKTALTLAYKNLMGAGLRTWLNVIVLSFAFVVIIFYNGMIDGWNEQAMRENIAWEGSQKDLTPILIRQASIYPGGRVMSVSLKGIPADQNAVKLPTRLLTESTADLPVLIGKRMASSAKLKLGDEVLIQWRDKNGTFDAANMTIAAIFDTNVGTVDSGQICYGK